MFSIFFAVMFLEIRPYLRMPGLKRWRISRHYLHHRKPKIKLQQISTQAKLAISSVQDPGEVQFCSTKVILFLTQKLGCPSKNKRNLFLLLSICFRQRPILSLSLKICSMFMLYPCICNLLPVILLDSVY